MVTTGAMLNRNYQFSLLEGQYNAATQNRCDVSSMKHLMELVFTEANSILLLESRKD